MPAKMLSHRCLTGGTFLTDAHLLAVLSVTHRCYQHKPTASHPHCRLRLELMAVSKSLRRKKSCCCTAGTASTPMCSILQRLHPQRCCCCTDCSHQLSRAQCRCLFTKNSSFCFLLCKEGLLGRLSKLQQGKRKIIIKTSFSCQN